jgi:hypothetical protein
VIRQGPFQLIRLFSLQASKEDHQSLSSEEVGGKNHIEVHVFRNREIFGAEGAFRKYGPKDLKVEVSILGSHLESAKRLLVDEFLRVIREDDYEVASGLPSHEASVRVLSLIYRAAARRLSGEAATLRTAFTF